MTAARGRPLLLLRLGSWYESLDQSPAPAPGMPALSLAPEILIRADARTLRAKAAPPVPGPAGRRRILLRAAELFSCRTVSCGTLGPQSASEFRAALWAWAGLPAALVDHWCELLTASVASLAAIGDDAGAGDRLPLTLVWMPGNTFTCLESVAAALASGSAVWVRPSAREPLSALRFVSALIQAGWPAGLLGYYPTTREMLPALVAVTDKQIIYGGSDVCAGLRTAPTATLRGPMRVCVLVSQTADPTATAAQLLPLVAAEGGRFCTTVRAILCLGDPEPLAADLAGLLDAIPFSPPDPLLPLAACRQPGAAGATEAAVRGRLAPGDRVMTGRPIVSPDGKLSYLAPTLIRLADRPHADLGWGNPPLLGFEAPFPLATITRVTPRQADGLTRTADTVHRLPAACPNGGS